MKNFIALAFVLVAACGKSSDTSSTTKPVESTTAPTAAAPAVAAPATPAAPAAAAPAAKVDAFGPFDRTATTYDLATMFPGATLTLEKRNDQVEGGGGDPGLFHGDTVVVEKNGEKIAYIELVGETNAVKVIELFTKKDADPEQWTPDEAKRPSLTARPPLAK